MMNIFLKNLTIPKKTDNILKKLKEKFHKKISGSNEEQNSTSSTNLNSLNNLNLNSGTNTYQNDEMWRIGIICKKDCYYITTEILKCLRSNGYEWKIVSSSYKIKCRRKKIDQKEDSNKYSNLNVLIQIFSNVDLNNKDEYLVDLHKLSGNTMEFLDFSNNFISGLLSESNMIIFK